MEPDASFAMSPSSTSNDVCSLRSDARDHGLRSACDFCHEKRIKCVLTEGQSRCQQCKRRNTEECNFSVKLKTGPKTKRSRSKADTSRHKRRKATPGPHLEIIDSPAVADSSAPTENQSSTRPLPTLVVSTNQQQGTGCLPGSHGNVFGRNGKRPRGAQQSMDPSRLLLFSSPAGGVAVGGKTSSSRLCRPYELRNFKCREGDLGSCYGGGGSSGGVGVNGMAARRGSLWSGLDFARDEDAFGIIQNFGAVVDPFDAGSTSNGGVAKKGVSVREPSNAANDLRSGLDFERGEDTFGIIQNFGAVVEPFDAGSATNGGVAKEDVSVREPSNAANEFEQVAGEVGTPLLGKIQDVSAEPFDAGSASNGGVAKKGVSVREPSNATNEFEQVAGEVDTPLLGTIEDASAEPFDVGSASNGGVTKKGVSVREPSNATNEFEQVAGEVDTPLLGTIQDASAEPFDVGSASNGGVAQKCVSVREPSNAANEFEQVAGEVDTPLLGKIQDVSCPPMVYQWNTMLSDTGASPAPLGASDSDAAGGMYKESHLERLKIIGSNPWGLHGDIYRGSGRL